MAESTITKPKTRPETEPEPEPEPGQSESNNPDVDDSKIFVIFGNVSESIGLLG
jgi:hypothetical protein